MATSKAEQLQITLELVIGSALESLKNLNSKTKEYANVLKEVKEYVDQYAKSAKISFGGATAQIGENIQKVNELNAALLTLGELETQRQLGMANWNKQVQKPQNPSTYIPLDQVNMRQARMENVADSIKKMGNLPVGIGETVTAIRNLQTLNPQLTFNQVGQAMIEAGANAQTVSKSLNKIKDSAKGVTDGFNVLRSAMGFLTAMAMSAIANSIMQAFKKIIDSASQAEQAYIRLGIAERALSQSGVDITPKELLNIAKEVTNTYRTISDIDALKMTSNLAILTKDLKLTEEQYRKMALAIPLIAQQSGTTIESATDQIITGLTKSGRGWADLGITVDAAIIRQEAVKSGLVASADAYNNLTAEQKQQVEVMALLNILEKNVAGNLKDQDKYLNSIAGSQAGVNRAWEDLTAQLGLMLTPAIIEGLQTLTAGLENLIRISGGVGKASENFDRLSKAIEYLTGIDISKEDGFFKQLLDFLNPLETMLAVLGAMLVPVTAFAVSFAKLFADLFDGVSIGDALKTFGENLGNSLVLGFSQALSVGLADEHGWLAKWIKEEWKSLTGVDLDTFGLETSTIDESKLPSDTATVTPEASSEVEEQNKKLQDALENLNEEIITSQEKLAQDMEDAAIDLGRKLVDIDTEYAQKRADVQRDFASKVADINRDYTRKLSDIDRDHSEKVRDILDDGRAEEEEAERKYREDAINREAEFQNEMRKMKEDFLMDLEDALHERDARQILKLIRDYNLKKTQAERDHELENDKAKRAEEADRARRRAEVARKIAEANEDRARAIADAEIERKRKLEDATLEFNEKMAQLAIERERERAEANLANQRKQEDLRKAAADRLELLKSALMREFDLTKSGLEQILELYRRHAENVSRITPTPPSPGRPNFGGGEGPGGAPGGGTGEKKPWWEKLPWWQNNSVGGESLGRSLSSAGVSMGVSTPMSRIGKNLSGLQNFSGSVGSGGDINIELTLSPDLESRIVKNTLNQTANIITRISRSKG